MDARFRLAADLEMNVTSNKQARRVEISIVSGAYYGDGKDTRTRDTYSVAPTEARAISSALMGAAAEV